MNLADTLVSGVIFGMASFASLQIHASSLRAADNLTELRELDAAVDLVLIQLHRELQHQSEMLTPEAEVPHCRNHAEALLNELIAVVPSGAPAAITLKLDAHDGLLAATVVAPELPTRWRWFSPAAYGLCGNPPSAPLPSDEPQV